MVGTNGVASITSDVKTVVTRVQVGPLEWGAMRTGILTVLRAGGAAG